MNVRKSHPADRLPSRTQPSGERGRFRDRLPRRAVLTGLAAVPLLGVPGRAAARAQAPLPSAGDLRSQVRAMAELGPRLPGSPAHGRFVDVLEAGFTAAGLQVQRDQHRFTYWEARRSGLDVVTGSLAGPVPVASAYPYSGMTPPEGVEGELVYLGPMPAPAFGADDGGGQITEFLRSELGALVSGLGARAQGKILLVDGPVIAPPLWAISPLISHKHDPGDTLPLGYLYKRIWTTIATLAPLSLLKRSGAKAVVFILDASPAAAPGQDTSFLFDYQDLPALVVDRETGVRLRRAASAGSRARLTLEATLTPDTRSDSLVAVLPGADGGREPMIVHTHSDGQNAFEENGGLGSLALARHFSGGGRSRLRRTLVFSSVTGHMAAELPETEGFIHDHPDIVERATACVTLEHLGATEWVDDRAGYRATGLPEPVGIFHSDGPILDAGIAAVKDADLRRSLLLKASPVMFGVGSALHKAGVPSLAFIAGPNYLIALDGQRGHLDKFSGAQMRREITWAADALRRLDAVPAARLRP